MVLCHNRRGVGCQWRQLRPHRHKVSRHRAWFALAGGMCGRGSHAVQLPLAHPTHASVAPPAPRLPHRLLLLPKRLPLQAAYRCFTLNSSTAGTRFMVVMLTIWGGFVGLKRSRHPRFACESQAAQQLACTGGPHQDPAQYRVPCLWLCRHPSSSLRAQWIRAWLPPGASSVGWVARPILSGDPSPCWCSPPFPAAHCR